MVKPVVSSIFTAKERINIANVNRTVKWLKIFPKKGIAYQL
jgi:hypothetical protein